MLPFFRTILRIWFLAPHMLMLSLLNGYHYKARWVLRGFTQHPGIDYDETFSPVVKPATVRTSIHQLDVKNTFLHGTLPETVYYEQPSDFVDISCPRLVCRWNRSLYGLKQAPSAWYSRFASHLLSLGFQEAKSDTSLAQTQSTSYTSRLHHGCLVVRICHEGSRRASSLMEDCFYLNISTCWMSWNVLVCQIVSLVRRQLTPIRSFQQLADATDFRSLVGALQYLTFTQPDISYAVQ
ncbi:hypothetical protein U9M48_042697 [Paspalum notatum var. saurae]|uniref:Reverse transcriptase Ty1/copia-type domain-containing protein n=1 Tax=Paspalum notatum var. saurae TaxID=547442 RepID=A0AAQ3UVV0_PASNO